MIIEGLQNGFGKLYRPTMRAYGCQKWFYLLRIFKGTVHFFG